MSQVSALRLTGLRERRSLVSKQHPASCPVRIELYDLGGKCILLGYVNPSQARFCSILQVVNRLVRIARVSSLRLLALVPRFALQRGHLVALVPTTHPALSCFMAKVVPSSRPRPFFEKRMIDHMVAAVAVFAQATSLTPAQVVGRAMNSDRGFLDRVRLGFSFRVRSYDRLMFYLSDNWPSGWPWPEGIERPAPLVKRTRKGPNGRTSHSGKGSVNPPGNVPAV